MHIKISTRVESPLQEVRAGFTEDLFLSLNPPFPPVKLQEFGGCETGDRVALELNFLLFRQQWVSDITHHEESDQKWLFVDEGTKLPFFLKSWQHRHVVEARVDGAEIIDDIRFTTGTFLTDFLMYPALLLQFLYRKPIYKKIFKRKVTS
jgi:ligand-binding SRPBCC domain-containing protein